MTRINWGVGPEFDEKINLNVKQELEGLMNQWSRSTDGPMVEITKDRCTYDGN